jgi:glucose-6-phosphate isomerase
VLAQKIVGEIESLNEPLLGHDSSTNTLVDRYRKRKK